MKSILFILSIVILNMVNKPFLDEILTADKYDPLECVLMRKRCGSFVKQIFFQDYAIENSSRMHGLTHTLYTIRAQNRDVYRLGSTNPIA